MNFELLLDIVRAVLCGVARVVIVTVSRVVLHMDFCGVLTPASSLIPLPWSSGIFLTNCTYVRLEKWKPLFSFFFFFS